MKITKKTDGIMSENNEENPFNRKLNYIFLKENGHKDMSEDECLIELFMEDYERITKENSESHTKK